MAKIDDTVDFDFLEDDSVELEKVEKKEKSKQKAITLEMPPTPQVVETVDVKIVKQKQDAEDIQKLNRDFIGRIQSEPKISYSPPKFYAKVLGTIYPLSINGHTFVVRFDGTPQLFPESIHGYLIDKLGRILDDNIPVQKMDEL